MKFTYRTKHNEKSVAAFWGKPIEDKPPYTISALSDDLTEVWVTDILGWPYNDINGMIRDISNIKSKEIKVRLNSPGGDPIDTFALYHALKEHPAKIIVRIEALAASAASFLALAGDEVQAYPSSLMMIHNSWCMTVGNKKELIETADILAKIDTNMQEIYSKRTKLGKKEVCSMMDNETWMTAKEMKEKGFIDTILDGKGAKASFDLSMFLNVPDEFTALNDEPIIRKYEKALRDVGASKSEAKSILARGLKTTEQEVDDTKRQEELALQAKLEQDKIDEEKREQEELELSNRRDADIKDALQEVKNYSQRYL
jgi:ATP-dependent protease ClpP protease subunit